MEKNGWKIFALILLTVFIVSLSFIGLLLYIGSQEIEKENICIYDVCVGYDSYTYANNICSCYEDHVVVYTKNFYE